MGSAGSGMPTGGIGSGERADPEDFRSAVRSWLDEHAPAKGDPEDFSTIHVVTAASREEYRARERTALKVTSQWQHKLFDAGLVGRSWPAEYGGRGAPRWQDDVVAEEQVRYGVSTKMMAVALEMVPPVLFAHGYARTAARAPPRRDPWRAELVPAALRAGRRVRPGQYLHPGHTGRRWVVGHRSKGVDVGGRQQRLRAAHRPHRTVRARPGRALVLCHAHVAEGCRRPPSAPALRLLPLQRGIPRSRLRTPTAA